MKSHSANANTGRWKEQRSIGGQLLPEMQREHEARRKNVERETFPVVTEMERKWAVMEAMLPADII